MGLGVLLVGVRATMERVADRTRSRWDTPRRTLIVGIPDAVPEVVSAPSLVRSGAFNVVGVVDALRPAAVGGEAALLGGLADLPRLIDAHEVEAIIIAGALPVGIFQRVLELGDAAGCKVLAVPGTAQQKGIAPTVVWHGGQPLVRLSRPAMRARHELFKRLFDVVAAAVGLVLLAPVLLAVALAVRASSPGPVLFRQRRVGRGGRHFWIYKFRSMVADAEARKLALTTKSVYATGHLFKLEHDPRVTRLGAVLRRTSLDELPQLWNVLRGDMSLVGPRPPLPSEVTHYDDHHYVRLCARPGITGPWQVGGRNGIHDFERVVALEHAYLRNWSLQKDFDILLRTIPVVLQQQGAH
jgi:exopolysaccharide biosynthesis polyprenyl glycosylphosphotransferase